MNYMKSAIIWVSAAINSVKKIFEKNSEVRTLLIFESRASLPMLHFVVCFNAFMSSWELNRVKVLIKC